MAAAGGGGDDSGDELEHDDADGTAAEPEPEYKVGYGKPPLHTRFKPGQSGNPAGRPKGRQSLARDLYEELQETIAELDGAGGGAGEGSSDESGDDSSETRRRISKQRAILRALTAKAMAGDARATALVLDLVERLIGAGQPGEDGAGEDWGRESRDPWEDPRYAGMSAREVLAAKLDEMAKRLGTDDEDDEADPEGANEADALEDSHDGGSPVMSGA